MGLDLRIQVQIQMVQTQKLEDAESQNDRWGEKICPEGSSNQHPLQGENREGLKKEKTKKIILKYLSWKFRIFY